MTVLRGRSRGCTYVRKWGVGKADGGKHFSWLWCIRAGSDALLAVGAPTPASEAYAGAEAGADAGAEAGAEAESEPKPKPIRKLRTYVRTCDVLMCPSETSLEKGRAQKRQPFGFPPCGNSRRASS